MPRVLVTGAGGYIGTTLVPTLLEGGWQVRAVLATDLALTELLAAYGFSPDMVMGHSLGEYGALVAAGAMPFADALEAVSARGKEMADMFNIHRAQENLLAQAQQGNFDGDRSKLTEMDALVAYLQMLGTLVDFSKYDEGYFAEFR